MAKPAEEKYDVKLSYDDPESFCHFEERKVLQPICAECNILLQDSMKARIYHFSHNSEKSVLTANAPLPTRWIAALGFFLKIKDDDDCSDLNTSKNERRLTPDHDRLHGTENPGAEHH